MSCSTSSSASTTSHERPVHCWNSRITAGSTVLAIKGDTPTQIPPCWRRFSADSSSMPLLRLSTAWRA
ncbi:Uncharacterised protein [Bordetella pertussis]|nr:Uncharacterised protein [Bordetella pertussis]